MTVKLKNAASKDSRKLHSCSRYHVQKPATLEEYATTYGISLSKLQNRIRAIKVDACKQ